MKKIPALLLIAAMACTMCAFAAVPAELSTEIEEEASALLEKEIGERFTLKVYDKLTFSTETFSGEPFNDTMLSREKPTFLIDTGGYYPDALVDALAEEWAGKEEEIDIVIVCPEEAEPYVQALADKGYSFPVIKECVEINALGSSAYDFGIFVNEEGKVVRLEESEAKEQHYIEKRDNTLMSFGHSMPGFFERGDENYCFEESDYTVEQEILYLTHDWQALIDLSDRLEAEAAEYNAYSADLSYLDFSSFDLEGNVIDTEYLSDYKLTLINLWEPWCGPCKQEMPHLEKLYESYKDRGFNILGIHADFDDLESVLASLHITYPIVDGTERFNKFQTGYVPTTFFVDSQGHVLKHEFNEEDLNYVDALHPQELFEYVYMGLSSYSYSQWAELVESLLEQVS